MKKSTRADVKVGFTCNNCCKFCAQSNKRDKYKDKTEFEIKRIIDESVKEHEEIVFTGGEPTMRNELPELVRYAKEKGFKKIHIQSNGRRFAYKDYCEELIKKGANIFGLAIHGHNAETHEKLTNATGSFNQTLQGIKNLVNLEQIVFINIVVNKLNYKHLPDIADILIDAGVNKYQFAFMHINPIIADDKDLIEEIVPQKSKVIPYIKEGLKRGIEAGIRVSTEAIPFCLLEDYKEYISENGGIPNGDVYNETKVIKDFENYRKKEGKKKAEKCKQCKYFKICEGPWKEYPEIFGWEEFKPVRD
ncbi:MAG: radical SAM protein [Candidatus Woesearchaeota archaeon]